MGERSGAVRGQTEILSAIEIQQFCCISGWS
jgi:hypothetical protein